MLKSLSKLKCTKSIVINNNITNMAKLLFVL